MFDFFSFKMKPVPAPRSTPFTTCRDAVVEKVLKPLGFVLSPHWVEQGVDGSGISSFWLKETDQPWRGVEVEVRRTEDGVVVQPDVEYRTQLKVFTYPRLQYVRLGKDGKVRREDMVEVRDQILFLLGKAEPKPKTVISRWRVDPQELT